MHEFINRLKITDKIDMEVIALDMEFSLENMNVKTQN